MAGSYIKFRKPIQWVPQKKTKICALHFKKSDIVCNKITAGAHPFLKVPSDHIDSDHNYSVPPYSLLVEKVKKMQESVLNLESRLKNERKRKWRQKNTAETLQEALTEAKLNITDASLENLMHRANDITGELISTVKRVKLDEKSVMSYSKEMQEFALSLHNISPAGYKYVRDKLDDILPCEKTIKRWLCKIDGSPGISQQALDYLKEISHMKKNGRIYCSLVMDEIHLKKDIHFDGKVPIVFQLIFICIFRVFQIRTLPPLRASQGEGQYGFGGGNAFICYSDH